MRLVDYSCYSLLTIVLFSGFVGESNSGKATPEKKAKASSPGKKAQQQQQSSPTTQKPDPTGKKYEETGSAQKTEIVQPAQNNMGCCIVM